MNSLNIMIVGVGGQGTLLASRILGRIAMSLGMDVKVSEVHGMAQRGGSVVTYIKMGDKIASPIIERGEADIILSFEQLEALRWLEHLKKDGRLIVNNQKIDPMPVITGNSEYPKKIKETLCEKCSVTMVDAYDIAKKCGTIKAVNVVMIGVLAAFTQMDEKVWLDAINDVVPEKFRSINIEAFQQGLLAGKA
ncbi:MAG: indolepyruvate oxidoreductase subunit beta [Eubacteriales bacterium]|nr:indolepyruvate oxidoreductase subunit beta [Eubacteriales bacterium]